MWSQKELVEQADRPFRHYLGDAPVDLEARLTLTIPTLA